MSVLIAVGQGLASAAGDSDLTIRYHFQNDAFVVSDVDLTLGGDGHGTLRFTRKGLAKPIERKVEIRPEVFEKMIGLLGRLEFLTSSEDYQSERQHPNLGTVTLDVSQGGRSRSVQFNYTENRDVEALTALLRGLATREIHVFDLQTAVRFAPLDTPAQLQRLEDELKLGRITDARSLLPLLREMTDDVALPLMARNRAAKLAERLEKMKQ